MSIFSLRNYIAKRQEERKSFIENFLLFGASGKDKIAAAEEILNKLKEFLDGMTNEDSVFRTLNRINSSLKKDRLGAEIAQIKIYFKNFRALTPSAPSLAPVAG